MEKMKFGLVLAMGLAAGVAMNVIAQETCGEVIAAAQGDSNAALASRDANVEKRVTERTAATLKINPRRVGSYDHKKGRIAIVGSASMQIPDPQQDKAGKWFAYRSMLAKRALLDAKMELAMALGAEMTAEEAAETFDVPAGGQAADTSKNGATMADAGAMAADAAIAALNGQNGDAIKGAIDAAKTAMAAQDGDGADTVDGDSAAGGGGVKSTVSSTIEFSAKHPIMGATVLYQEESYVNGEYKVALSLIWSQELQAAAVALLKGDENFKEEKVGKLSIDEWLDKQVSLPMMIGPRQFLDSDGVRHFIGISARAVGSNPNLRQKNMLLAQNDARATTVFSVLADVEARTASESLMEQYTENSDDLDALSMDSITESMEAKISQKIKRQQITGLNMLFQDTVEHPLCPGIDMYVVAYEINAENAREMQKNADKLAEDRVDVAKKNAENLAKKEEQMKKIEDAKNGFTAVDDKTNPNAKPAPKMQQGVVGGDADADDDF